MQPEPPILDDGKEPSEPDAPCQATEDEDFYFHFVTFQVEDRLFRVPSKPFFKESPVFCAIYKLSAQVRADHSDPIKLPVTKEGFRVLLKVLLSFPVKTPRAFPVHHLSRREWKLVLILASKWEFLRVRARAIVVLTCFPAVPLTSLEKIILGRELFITSWVIDGFIKLVRATTITDEEALLIDNGAATTAYKLFRIREQRIVGELPSAMIKVEEIFKEELDRLRSKEELFESKKIRPQARISP